MLCPEVWNFHVQDSSLQFLEDISKENKLLSKNIQNFYYNHLVTVIIPDALKVSKSVSDCLIQDTEYYKINNLPVEELVNIEFLISFVKSGKLTLLSVDKRIDCDNCITITPKGQLVVSVTKDCYEQLGLSGKLVKDSKTKIQDHYVVTIDLQSLQENKNNYDRTRQRLKILGTFDVILNWQPPDTNICPSSIAKYFHDLKYVVKLCKVNNNSKILYSLNVPHMDVESLRKNKQFRSDFVEWLGYVCISDDRNEENQTEDQYLSSYETPEPNKLLGQVRIMTFKGLFTSEKVESLLNNLKEYLKSDDIQWVAMYVEGFYDCPTNWLKQQSNNSYIIILNENKKLLIIPQY